jgi:hypothetical protein
VTGKECAHILMVGLIVMEFSRFDSVEMESEISIDDSDFDSELFL